ncbi:unnamed protein product, partial [Gulo gulo]
RPRSFRSPCPCGVSCPCGASSAGWCEPFFTEGFRTDRRRVGDRSGAGSCSSAGEESAPALFVGRRMEGAIFPPKPVSFLRLSEKATRKQSWPLHHSHSKNLAHQLSRTLPKYFQQQG